MKGVYIVSCKTIINVPSPSHDRENNRWKSNLSLVEYYKVEQIPVHAVDLYILQFDI